MKKIEYYIDRFSKLRRDNKNGGAPHKPILLLSVINLFERGVYDSKRIYLNPDLVSTFRSLWSILVISNHTSNIALPFSHLRSEPFWILVPNEGCEKWIESKSSMKTFSNLRVAVDYASIDNELFQLLMDKQYRTLLSHTLLDLYFKDTKDRFIGNDFDPDLKLSEELLNEKTEDYKRKILHLKSQYELNDYEEEIFVRSGVFKRGVVKLYNSTCAISGLRVSATINITMVDACHIIPFSESYDDTLTNGLALCPNLHRAFDRGIISVDQDYRVLVSSRFTESDSLYGIKKYERKKILLPNDPKYSPLKENLRWHKQNVFMA